MVELDADHVPDRRAEAVLARRHRRQHEHLVQVKQHPAIKIIQLDEYTVGRICLTRGSSRSNIGLLLRML